MIMCGKRIYSAFSAYDHGDDEEGGQFATRGREQVARFFNGTDLVEPGLVRVEEWRPDPAAGHTVSSTMWCAVGRKP
jgi:hypothetical protein